MKGIDPLIRKAGHFARHAHRGQQRKYRGSPYSHHPFRVARAVAGHEIGSRITVAAALLHDTIEDTGVREGDLRREFGDEIADLVVELTKPDYPESVSRAQRFELELKRLATISRRAKIIKLLDRMDNVRDSAQIQDRFTEIYLAESKALARELHDADPKVGTKLKKLIEACEAGTA